MSDDEEIEGQKRHDKFDEHVYSNYMRSDDFFEVVVLVEGIEPFTSSTVQARHSYSFGHDIVVNGNFMPCTFITKHGTTMVDFGKFHQIIRPEEES